MVILRKQFLIRQIVVFKTRVKDSHSTHSNPPRAHQLDHQIAWLQQMEPIGQQFRPTNFSGKSLSLCQLWALSTLKLKKVFHLRLFHKNLFQFDYILVRACALEEKQQLTITSNITSTPNSNCWSINTTILSFKSSTRLGAKGLDYF